MKRNSTRYQHVVDDMRAAEQVYLNAIALERHQPAALSANELQPNRRWYMAACRALALATKLRAVESAAELDVVWPNASEGSDGFWTRLTQDPGDDRQPHNES